MKKKIILGLTKSEFLEVLNSSYLLEDQELEYDSDVNIVVSKQNIVITIDSEV